MANFSELQAITGLIPLLMFSAWLMDAGLRSRVRTQIESAMANGIPWYPWPTRHGPTVQTSARG
jgi:hypothetical protein